MARASSVRSPARGTGPAAAAAVAHAAPAALAPEGAAPRTPAGELSEATLHGLIGYQLAQATIAAGGVFAREVGAVHELRPVEYTVLALVAENPGATPGRIAEALALTKPNVTLWLDRLEARALLARQPSRTDGRALELRLTAAGRRLVEDATARLLEGERRALGALSAAERALLAELLHRVGRQRG